jgi:hypothetical protein
MHEQREQHLSFMVSSILDTAADIRPSSTTHKLVASRASAAYGGAVTEHPLFQVTERSIFIDFSSKHDSNAFLNLFPNVLSPLPALR